MTLCINKKKNTAKQKYVWMYIYVPFGSVACYTLEEE